MCYHCGLVSVTSGVQSDRLLLDLGKVRSGGEHVERRYAPAMLQGALAELEGADFSITAPVELSFDIRKQGDEYRLEGRVVTTLEVGCSRCLESFPLPVACEFDLRYLPQVANAGEGEREVDPDDLTVAFYRDEVIDLGHLMSEQFYLVMPMKPLCSTGCRGLCPSCGTNLNRSSCGCDTSWHDPRLEGLRALLENRRSK